MSYYNPISNLFEGSDQVNLVNKLGDPLEKLNKVIDWEKFSALLSETFPNQKSIKGGRPRLDPLMMFKVLILQKLYNLSDHSTEYQIADRLSFQRFIGIKSIKGIPDENTIWLFREQLMNAGLVDKLFNLFKERLETAGFIANEGKIIDASIVDAPKQRNSRQENEKIKKGEENEEWNNNPHKSRQKDTDASWTKKHGKTFYGYKDHIKVDSKSKLIHEYQVGTASEHDSQVIEELINVEEDKGQPLWADSAYRGETIEEKLKSLEIKSQIHEKATKKNPLTLNQKKNNTEKSKTRSRVEHIFGYMHQNMGGLKIRTIGISRAACQVGMINLVYNMCRVEYLQRINWRGLNISQI